MRCWLLRLTVIKILAILRLMVNVNSLLSPNFFLVRLPFLRLTFKICQFVRLTVKFRQFVRLKVKFCQFVRLKVKFCQFQVRLTVKVFDRFTVIS